jgi:hypothetical protein
MKMTLVMDGDHAKMDNGMPVYKYEDGTEAPFDAEKTTDNLEEKVDNLTEEKDRHFKAANKAKETLKTFKDIDPEKAKEAMETVKALKDKQLLDANGVKAIKAEMAENFEAEKRALAQDVTSKLGEKDTVIDSHKKAIFDLAVFSQFASSDWFNGENRKCIYKAHDAVRIWGSNFDVEVKDDGTYSVNPLYDDGKPILSKTEHGSPAKFDEAIEKLIELRSDKADLLRDPNASHHGPASQGNQQHQRQTGDKKDTQAKISQGLKKRYPGMFPGQ